MKKIASLLLTAARSFCRTRDSAWFVTISTAQSFEQRRMIVCPINTAKNKESQ